MAKKRSAVSLRKPSPAPDAQPLPRRPETTQVTIVGLRDAAPAAQEVMTVEAFVSGAAEALERALGDLPPAKLLELLERGPAGYRELTVYLPQPLARDLSLHCLQRDLDMNRLVAAALERHLLSGSHFDKRRLARAARALLRLLAQRAQVFWAARHDGWGSAARAALAHS